MSSSSCRTERRVGPAEEPGCPVPPLGLELEGNLCPDMRRGLPGGQWEPAGVGQAWWGHCLGCWVWALALQQPADTPGHRGPGPGHDASRSLPCLPVSR